MDRLRLLTLTRTGGHRTDHATIMALDRRPLSDPCSEVLGLLVDYLDGRLPKTIHAELERHLAACETCVSYLRTYRSTVSLLGSLREEDLPPELCLTLRAFLDRHADN